MANIANLLSTLQGNVVDPFSQLLASRGAQQAPFTSQVKPIAQPNLVQQQAQAQDQSTAFYQMLSSISDRINTNRAEAEDAIARNAQKAQEEALMRKIRSMIPSVSYGGSGGFTGGGGSNYPIAPFPSLGSSSGKKSSGGGILPILPDITKGGPAVAPPRSGCTSHMIELGLCG